MRKKASRKSEKRIAPTRKALGIFSNIPTVAGPTVNANTALTLSALYSGVKLISETLAMLPAGVYQRVNGAAREATDHKLHERLQFEPNPRATAQTFFEAMQATAILRGNAYAEIEFGREPGNRGDAVALWPLPASTRPVIDARGLAYKVPKPAGGFRKLPSWAVIHVPGMGFDGLQGYPVIDLLCDTVGLSLALNEYAARFVGQGTSLTGVIQHPGELSDGAARRLRESWAEKNAGLPNAHRVAVLEEGMTFAATGVTPEQAQFLESRKFQVIEIARLLRVPPHMLYDLDRATFSNIEHQGIDYVSYTLGPWLRRWELELRRKLFSTIERRDGYFVAFDVWALLRGDLKSRFEAYAIGRNGGWLNVDEIRRFEDMPALANGAGQEFLKPSTMQPAGQGTTNED